MNAPVESKLLPCPFCGGEAKLSHPPSLWEPGSGKADATMAMVICKAMCREGYQSTNAAITAWNTRTNQVAELVEALDRLETANDSLCAKRSKAVYELMDRETRDELDALDEARRNARALIASHKGEQP